MTTARDIITDCLKFRLNRLAPGESADDDLLSDCLRGLNSLVDEINGAKTILFREILTRSTAITGTTATLGTDWAGLSAGDEILGATVEYGTNLDVPMDPITVGQYANISIKTVTTYPAYYAHDGLSTVYLYPKASGHYITLRTRQPLTDFADLDTDYTLPKGGRSGLCDMLAERMSYIVADVPVTVIKAAAAARSRLTAQAVNPAILTTGEVGVGPVAKIKRGY